MLLHTLAMLMMLPRPARQHAGQHGLDGPELRAHVQVEARSSTRRRWPAARVPLCTKPAQLKSTSSAGRLATSALIAALSSTSSCTACDAARRPRSFRAAARLTSVAQTCAPSAASASALARPMPCPAAVTSAVFPSSLIGCLHRVGPLRSGFCRMPRRRGSKPILIGLTTWPIQDNPNPCPMPLQTVEPQRLYRQIAEQLRALIDGGRVHAGAPAAGRARPGQAARREPAVGARSLIALEVEGWVEVRTGSGVYVLDRGAPRGDDRKVPAAEWGPLELIRARRVVEGEIASLAATQAKRKHIEAIQRRDRAHARKTPTAASRRSPGDRAFHTAIAQACGNVVLLETVQTLLGRAPRPAVRAAGRLLREPCRPGAWPSPSTRPCWTRSRAHDAQGARAPRCTQHMDKSHARFSASWRRANHPDVQP